MYLLHVAVVIHSLAYWFTSLIKNPGVPFALRTLYGAGDIQYYPLVAAAGRLNFGEPMLAESYRAGWTAFPLGSIAGHALVVRVLGAAGYMVMDVVAALGHFIVVGMLLRVLGLPRLYVRLVAATVTTGAMFHYWRQLIDIGAIHGRMFPAFWGHRFPRPLITESLMVLALAGLVRLARGSRGSLPSPLCAFAVGGSLSIVAQGDVHAAFSLFLGAAAVLLLLLVERGPTDRVFVRCALALLAGAIVLILPALLQQMLTHPDLPRRLGLFIVPRSEPLADFERQTMRLTNLLGATLVAVLATRFVRPETSRLGLGLAVVGFVAVVSMFALALFSVVLGYNIQTSHFHDRWYRFSSYAFMAAGLWLLLGFWTLLRKRAAHGIRLWLVERLLPCVGVVLLALATVAQLTRDYAHVITAGPPRFEFARYTNVPNYRGNLSGLMAALKVERERGARILGTLDHHVLVYWTAFLNGFVFVPDPFSSAAPDAEIERRLLAFAKLVGLPPALLAGFLEDPAILNFFLGHNKYQASIAHHFAPLSDYSPAVRASIEKSAIYDTWRLALPISERQRLERRFAEVPPAGEGGLAAPDLLLLSTVDLSAGLLAPPDHYDLVYENQAFRLWSLRHRTM
jgi:hypothetical protein